MLVGGGWCRAEGNRGKKKWDNCNHVINKIYFKKIKKMNQWEKNTLLPWRVWLPCLECCPIPVQEHRQVQGMQEATHGCFSLTLHFFLSPPLSLKAMKEKISVGEDKKTNTHTHTHTHVKLWQVSSVGQGTLLIHQGCWFNRAQ